MDSINMPQNNFISKKFVSIDNKHSFTILIIEDTAYFSIDIIDQSQYKTFLFLLKNGIEYMCDNNIKYVKQNIMDSDANLFKKSTIIHQYDCIVVKTHINDFIEEICDALGINRL
jgi:hypothetical protein